MKKALLLGTILLCFWTKSAFAQELSGESEFGADGKGESSFSQYIFYDVDRANVLTRYFWVNHILEQGEFAVGPTIRLRTANILKLQFGGTTNREVMLAGTLITRISGHNIVYIADGKIATKSGAPGNLYEKLFIALNKKGTWNFELQDLQVGREQEFLRIGGEYRHDLPHNLQLFVSPFYDPIRNAVGAETGFRFFLKAK